MNTLLRIFLACTIAGLFLLWIQIKLPEPTKPLRNWYWDGLRNYSNVSQHVLALVPSGLHRFLLPSPSNANTSTGNDTETKPGGILDILEKIEVYNDAQIIYNEDKFGPVQNDTIIIAVQVHTRLVYLRHLIVSLAQAQDIERALLVFSHDYYDDEINSLVRSIDFTKVMQIFYPYSLQTHPNVFPGVDFNDCPEDLAKELAIKLQCNNANHPDVEGHYRNAEFAQTKHHWWWKANRIFNQLQVTAEHSGMVLFLEEDHYVAEDFLYMLKLLRKTANKECPQCEMISLGTYTKFYRYHNSTFSKAMISPWHSTYHNMGFAFNRTVWNNITALERQFCTHDDYNWDYSLLHLSQHRPGREKFKVIMCKGPRVFHIGKCGIHHRGYKCNPSTTIHKAQLLLQRVKGYLFPDAVKVYTFEPKEANFTLPFNGGWADIRDQELCTNMTKVGRQIIFVRKHLLKKFDAETKTG